MAKITKEQRVYLLTTLATELDKKAPVQPTPPEQVKVNAFRAFDIVVPCKVRVTAPRWGDGEVHFDVREDVTLQDAAKHMTKEQQKLTGADPKSLAALAKYEADTKAYEKKVEAYNTKVAKIIRDFEGELLFSNGEYTDLLALVNQYAAKL